MVKEERKKRGCREHKLKGERIRGEKRRGAVVFALVVGQWDS